MKTKLLQFIMIYLVVVSFGAGYRLGSMSNEISIKDRTIIDAELFEGHSKIK